MSSVHVIESRGHCASENIGRSAVRTTALYYPLNNMAKKHEIVLTRHKMYFKFNNTRARAPFPQIFGMRGNNLGPEPRVVVQNWGPVFMAFYLDKSNEILTNQYSDLNNKKKH